MLRGCTRHMSTWRRLSQRLRGSDAMRNGPPRPIPQPMVAGTYHGVQRVDEFAWLHRTEQPEVGIAIVRRPGVGVGLRRSIFFNVFEQLVGYDPRWFG